MHDNYDSVVHQLEQLGCTLRARDLPLRIDTARKVTCGKGGKFWYRLYTFAPDNSARRFIVGTLGSYRTGEAVKVEWDKQGLSAETMERFRTEQAAARERERAAAQAAAEEAALTAAQMWQRGSRTGHSPYLAAKGVEPESCRFLPDGSVLVPLLRYDLPREQALKAVQRIYPGPRTDKNPGVRAAKAAAKHTERCEVVYPVFDAVLRQPKDTDFNDLHQRQGLAAVERQLGSVVRMILRRAELVG